MPTALLTILLAAAVLTGPDAGGVEHRETDAVSSETTGSQPATYTTPAQLLSALAKKDTETTTLSGDVRYTIIRALENDRQMRTGQLAIRNGDNTDSTHSRKYAVRFHTLEMDQRRQEIDEQYIFDGRWFVERLPNEKQFNKRELVPEGQTLDPMELMRDAPFWVSLGRDQDRLLASYNAELRATDDGLIDNPDFPELRWFTELPHVTGTTQLMLTPKPGSGFEDDWEWVRIWTNPETLLPTLYIKADWTGDLQIVELFKARTNEDIPASVFDTTTPDARSGWRVQISNWRSDSPTDAANP
ncbi:MAG: outer membrane lipoprotein carrier protein LolA [Phycisphaerales bacterium JB052]